MPITTFPREVAEQLKTYVYRLIDPRNGETLYVGKGKGDRVFAHSRAAIERDEEDPSEKLTRIREIMTSGFAVAHVIHRHGMDDKMAFEVEAALIVAYPGLSNVAGGVGNSDYGAMHAREIVERYQAEDAIFEHAAILINVNHSSIETSLYEATRHSWKINPKKASRADVVLAVRRGIIIAAYVADEWLPATSANFPGREPCEGRQGFVGREAPKALQKKYCRKRLPAKYCKRGAANPIKYTYK